MQVRPEVERFAEAMERKLQQNDHKGGWDNESLDWLMARMIQEAGELAELIAVLQNKTPFFMGKVQEEAADVANFAMMIWDIAERARGGEA